MFSTSFLVLSGLLFVVGAAVGSFVNVVINRTIKDEQWLTGRSRCDHCGKSLAWFDLVPILSYLFLQGKSRCCKQPISIGHPVVEIITGSLFVWWYWGGSLFFNLTKAPLQVIQPMFWLVVGVLLIIIFFTDLWYMLIPDLAVVSLFGLAVLYRLLLVGLGIMQFEDFVLTIFAAAVVTLFFGGLWYFTRGKGMGFGDVKLVVPLVVLSGWPKSLVGLFLAFLIGAGVGIWLILMGQKGLKNKVPFGPFLIVGTCISLVWGGELWRWYVGLLW